MNDEQYSSLNFFKRAGEMVEKRAWSYLGHILRRPEAPPTRFLLAETGMKRRRGRPRNNQLKKMENLIARWGMNFEDAANVTRNMKQGEKARKARQ